MNKTELIPQDNPVVTIETKDGHIDSFSQSSYPLDVRKCLGTLSIMIDRKIKKAKISKSVHIKEI